MAGKAEISQHIVSGSHEIVCAGDGREVLTFARTVPFSDISPTGMLYMNLDTENLSRILQNGSDPYPAFMYAIDRDGRLLFSGRSGK